MKPNPKAIKALKRVMSPKQRKEFVKCCKNQNGINFLERCNYNTVIFKKGKGNELCDYRNSFSWTVYGCDYHYWTNTFGNLTSQERKLKLFIKL